MISFDDGLGPSTNNSTKLWVGHLLGTIALEKSIQEKYTGKSIQNKGILKMY